MQRRIKMLKAILVNENGVTDFVRFGEKAQEKEMIYTISKTIEKFLLI